MRACVCDGVCVCVCVCVTVSVRACVCAYVLVYYFTFDNYVCWCTMLLIYVTGVSVLYCFLLSYFHVS